MQKKSDDALKERRYLDKNSWLDLYQNFSDCSVEDLKTLLPTRRPYDNSVVTSWYGISFSTKNTYKTPATKPWPKTIEAIKNQVQVLYKNVNFNSCQLNYYYKEEDHMGWHTDYMQQVPMKPIIANLSFGASRTMLFRLKPSDSYNDLDKDYWRSPKVEEGEASIKLENGTLLVMGGQTQDNWVHAVAPSHHKSKRISLVFREYIL